MSRRSLVERALIPAGCDHPRVSMRRGDVIAPGLVSTEPDDVAGSAVDGQALEGSGTVLSVDGHRVFIPHGPVAPPALVERVERVAEQATHAQEAVSATHTEVVELEQAAATIAMDAHNALLHASLAMGLWIIPHDAALPTVRRDGTSPLELGDVVYQRNASTEKFTGVKFWDGAAWAPLVMAAEYLIAIESVVSDLIAANVEITAPTIIGGLLQGAVVRTAAPTNPRIHLDTINRPPTNEPWPRLLFADANDRRVIEMAGNTLDGMHLEFFDPAPGNPTLARLGPTFISMSDTDVDADHSDASGFAMSVHNWGQGRGGYLEGTPHLRLRAWGDPTVPGGGEGNVFIDSRGPDGAVYVDGRKLGATLWTSLAAATGYTSTAEWSVLHGLIHFDGSISINSGSFPTGFVQPFATPLPVGARPRSIRYMPMTRDGRVVGRVAISAAGVLSVSAITGETPERLDLASIIPFPVVQDD